MTSEASRPLSRERNLILASLLVLAGGAWAFLIWQSTLTNREMMGLTMGMSVIVFLSVWIVMMIAMMFPTAAPMILTFARVHAARRQRGQSYVPTWVFVGAYLLIWILFGTLAYALALVAQAFAESSTWLMDNAGRIGGTVLVLTGLYQLSPLKRVCLTKCRTPLGFILGSWRDGYLGSFQMGVAHGLYCLGCCWLLFVLLFPLGMMNVAAMALITLLIFAEKSLPVGRQISWVAAVVLIACGLLVIAMPEALPTMVGSPTM